MKMLRAVTLGLLCFVMMLSLAACGSKPIAYAPERTGIFVDLDGIVKCAEITDFSNAGFSETRYREEELKKMIEELVAAYNTSVGASGVYNVEKAETLLPAAVEEVSVKKDRAKLILSFDGADSFMNFIGGEYGVTGLSCTAVAGSSLPSNVAMSDASGKAVDAAKAFKKEKDRVVIITGEALLTTAGKIAYLSAGATLVDPHTVQVSSEQPVYIVYR